MNKQMIHGILSVLFLASPVYAQDQQPSPEDIVAKMQSKLNLTQDQVTAVTPIIEKYASKRAELRQNMEDGTSDSSSIHAQMKQLKEDEAQELSQVLSADQLSQWKTMQSQGHHRHKDESGENPPPQD